MASGFLAIVAAGFGVLGCLNEYETNAPAIAELKSAFTALQAPPPLRPWPERARELEAKLAKSRDQRTLNDLAVALIHIGETKRAIPLLEEVEARFPGEYRTATNLGTAFELDGRVDEAFHWIREGLKRNPESHDGSEWLHLKILEAKLALRSDPKWLESNRASGIQYADADILAPTGPHGGKLSLADVWRSLQRQLRERLPFTPAKDEIVSQLLWDYAEITAHRLHRRRTAARDIYALAASHSAAREGELRRIVAKLNTMLELERADQIRRRNASLTIGLLGIPAAASGVVWLLDRRRVRRQELPQGFASPWLGPASLLIFIISSFFIVVMAFTLLQARPPM